MKSIVIVHHTGDWGGGTKSLIDLCEMLHDEYSVTICIPKGYPEFRTKISRHGAKTHELKNTAPFINVYSGRPPLVSVVTMRSLKSLWGMKQFGDEIMSLKPDIVIFNTLITAVSAIYLSGFTKVICMDRETLTSGISKFLYRRLLDKHLNAITFLSEYERKKLDFHSCDSLVLPDCVKMDTLIKEGQDLIRSKEGIASDKFVILFMGGLAKIKGADVIFKALDMLDDRFLLVFAGTINEEKLSRKQLLHDIKYPNHYLFKKRTRKYYYRLKGSSRLYEAGLRDSIDELIVASDIVVFPSTSVHQPRPCIEAGAYGKPVIISDYKETKEYFKNGYNALIFKPGDSDDLAQKIRYAFNNQDEMKRLGENNRTMTELKHDFYDCKKRLYSLIEKVCDNAD